MVKFKWRGLGAEVDLKGYGKMNWLRLELRLR